MGGCHEGNYVGVVEDPLHVLCTIPECVRRNRLGWTWRWKQAVTSVLCFGLGTGAGMTGRIWDLADKVEEGVPTMGHVSVKTLTLARRSEASQQRIVLSSKFEC